VTWAHLKAFLWLRVRLLRNQWRRAGPVNAVLMGLIAGGAAATAGPVFVATLALGAYLVPRTQPIHLLYAWDALVAVFLFFWMIGLVADLQRNEPLSLSKFLHLPVSANGAFLINYLASLVRLSLVVFVPIMLGLALAQVLVEGAARLVVPALLAAFLLMVTALTYQFQGWLGALVSNPRRRRTVMVVVSGAFVLVCQLPNLANFYTPWGVQGHTEQADREAATRLATVARTANALVPAGWLPLGATAAAEGRFAPAALGLLGMTVIGAGSLWRAYRATVRTYQGQATARRARVPRTVEARPPGALPLGSRLPGLSEPAAAVALGGLRTLARAPEAKVALLMPLMMLFAFGSMIVRQRHAIPQEARPLLAISAMVLVLFGMLPFMCNQFGFDRDGFRVFVLGPTPRRDILLGKNVAYGGVTLAAAVVLLAIVQALCPLRFDHVLAMAPQYVSMFLVFCLLMNLMSIYTPLPVAAGALKTGSPKLTTVLLQLLMFMVVFPISQSVTVLPLAAEAALRALGWGAGVPIYLLLALLECAALAALYALSLRWLGDLLQGREQAILEVVTGRAS
jgi:ABC-2 type transport system permease protein